MEFWDAFKPTWFFLHSISSVSRDEAKIKKILFTYFVPRSIYNKWRDCCYTYLWKGVLKYDVALISANWQVFGSIRWTFLKNCINNKYIVYLCMIYIYVFACIYVTVCIYVTRLGKIIVPTNFCLSFEFRVLHQHHWVLLERTATKENILYYICDVRWCINWCCCKAEHQTRINKKVFNSTVLNSKLWGTSFLIEEQN